MPILENNNNYDFTAIDFFCGGGGMTCGLRQVDIRMVARIDIDKNFNTEA